VLVVPAIASRTAECGGGTEIKRLGKEISLPFFLFASFVSENNKQCDFGGCLVFS
jgi:hypothetical protein